MCLSTRGRNNIHVCGQRGKVAQLPLLVSHCLETSSGCIPRTECHGGHGYSVPAAAIDPCCRANGFLVFHNSSVQTSVPALLPLVFLTVVSHGSRVYLEQQTPSVVLIYTELYSVRVIIIAIVVVVVVQTCYGSLTMFDVIFKSKHAGMGCKLALAACFIVYIFYISLFFWGIRLSSLKTQYFTPSVRGAC